MNLLLDIGNARIKWALQSDAVLQSGNPLPHNGKAFKDVARPAWKEIDTPERVLVSNVRGEAYAKSVQTWIKRRWKLAPEFLRPDTHECGVTHAYSNPSRLGADRWSGLIAVNAKYSLPAIIVDCGTAITVDALDADSRHVGGLIIPGIELMKGSLSRTAPGIELGDDDTPQQSLLARSTEAAVSGGVIYAAVSLIDRVLFDLKNELGKKSTTVLTGGDAQKLLPLLSGDVIHDPDLVLKGLSVFAEETACVT